MTTTFLLPRRRRVPATSRPLVSAAGLGALLGLLSSACVISVHDGGWGSDQDECFDEFGDCMDDAESQSEFAACESTLDACIDGGGSHGDEAEGDGDGDGPPADSGDGDGDVPPHTDSGSGSDSSSGPDAACFEIYATCIGDAETLQEVEACEVLFDHCANPGECPSCGCPQAELDACLDGFAGCLETVTCQADADACAAEFDACAAQFDFSECQAGYDEATLSACLDQHGLCVACADTPEQLAACTSAFDTCLNPTP